MTGNDQQRAQFEALVRPHLDGLYRLAYSFCANPDDAEDLVQELMVRLYRNPRDLSRITELRPWLVKALHNLFIDQWRHRRRTPFGYLHSDPWETVFENQPGAQVPEQENQAAELRRQVLAALYTLRKEHRALLVLHDIQGYELPELAKLLNLPLGTLKSRLFRARRKLRIALGERNLLDYSDVVASEV